MLIKFSILIYIIVLFKNHSYLNNNTKPYISNIIPTKGQPNITMTIPPKKATEALIL